MEGRVLSLKGKTKKKVALPELFEESYRPDLIKKAVVVSQANRRQAYGPQRTAGLKTQPTHGALAAGSHKFHV
jgi:large subunit ribosomal protein L4e